MRAHHHIAARSLASLSLACVAATWPAPNVDLPALSTDAPPREAPLPDCSTSTIVLSRAEVDTMLTALDAPATSCNVVPAFEGGHVIGFKVFGVRDGSLGARLCLQNGDVVTRIDGLDLTSPEHGLAILDRVREATRVDVELRRRGEPTRMSYVIR